MKHLNFLIFIIVINSSCGSIYTIHSEGIGSGEFPFKRGFELAELTVNTFDSKQNYPISYQKVDIIVCFIDEDSLYIQEQIQTKYLNIEQYWNTQDDKDSLVLNTYKSIKKGTRTVYFHKTAPNVKWIHFPFHENDLMSQLSKPLKQNTWYKISHFDYKKDDICSYFLIKEDGEIIRFYHW